MTSLFSNKKKTKGDSTPKGRQYHQTRLIMPYTRFDFDGALLDFRLFLKFGAGPSRLGARRKLPSCPPPPLGDPANIYVTENLSGSVRCRVCWNNSLDDNPL